MFFLLCQQPLLLAQFRSSSSRYFASIPNPESDLALFSFAMNKSVAHELKLSDEVREKLLFLHAESGGRSGGTISSPAINTQGIPTKEDIYSIELALAAKQVENTDAMRAILNKSQLARLRQMVYQIEIDRVGLPEALIDGFTGIALEIKDFQKAALAIRAKAIESKASAERAKVVETLLLEMNLTEEQLRVLKIALGKEFFLECLWFSI